MRRRDRELAARRLAGLAIAPRPPEPATAQDERAQDGPAHTVPGRRGAQSPDGARSPDDSLAATLPGASWPPPDARDDRPGWTPDRGPMPSSGADVVAWPGPGGPASAATTPLDPPAGPTTGSVAPAAGGHVPPAVGVPTAPVAPRSDGHRRTDEGAPPPATLDALELAAGAYAREHAPTAGLVAHRARRHRLRWSVEPRTAAAASVAVLLVAGAVALHAARGAPSAPVVLPTPGASATTTSTAVHVAQVVVDVVGQVAAPGVVRLPEGSRVVDAVAAAGGATQQADLSAINLARVLVDGEQIVVPQPGEAPSQVATSSAAGDLVDVNTADAATLDSLPGIGPVLAQRIVDARTKKPFSSVDELADVPGIGPALLSQLRPLVHT